jgi:hypothetical protein
VADSFFDQVCGPGWPRPLDSAATAWRTVRSLALDSPNRVITCCWLSGLPAAMDVASAALAAASGERRSGSPVGRRMGQDMAHVAGHAD